MRTVSIFCGVEPGTSINFNFLWRREAWGGGGELRSCGEWKWCDGGVGVRDGARFKNKLMGVMVYF
jgi:hypothetical protein